MFLVHPTLSEHSLQNRGCYPSGDRKNLNQKSAYNIRANIPLYLIRARCERLYPFYSIITASPKQIVLVLMDICILPLMMWLAYAIRLARPNVQVMQGLDAWYIYVGVVGILIFALLGIYRAIVRSFNEDYLLRILIGTFIQIVALYTIKN